MLDDYNKKFGTTFQQSTYAKYKKDVAKRLVHKMPYQRLGKDQQLDMLIVSNPLLNDYTGEDAYKRAVATYGGETNVFLRPEGTTTGNTGSSSVESSGEESSGGGSENQGTGDGGELGE